MTKKRLGSLIAFTILVAILLGGGLYLRNFLRRQVNKRIQSVVSYSRIHLHAFPPSLILEDVRTVSPSPSFSARRVTIILPFRSLFRNEKPLAVFIEKPSIKVFSTPGGGEKKGSPGPSFVLPFAIEKGLVRDGEFSFVGDRESFQLKGVKASLEFKDNTFVVRAEAAESSFLLQLKVLAGKPGQPTEAEQVCLFREGRLDQGQRESVRPAESIGIGPGDVSGRYGFRRQNPGPPV